MSKQLKTFSELVGSMKRVNKQVIDKPYTVLIFGDTKSGKTTTIYNDILNNRPKFNNIFHICDEADGNAEYFFGKALNKVGGYFEHVESPNDVDADNLIPNSHYVIDDQHTGSAKQNPSYKLYAKIIQKGRKKNIGASLSCHSDKHIPDIWWKADKIYFKKDPTFKNVLENVNSLNSFDDDYPGWQVFDKETKMWTPANFTGYHHVGQVVQNLSRKIIPGGTYKPKSCDESFSDEEQEPIPIKQGKSIEKKIIEHTPIIVASPEDLASNLEIKLSAYRAGNKEIKYEITQIMDKLMELGYLTKQEYSLITKEYKF